MIKRILLITLINTILNKPKGEKSIKISHKQIEEAAKPHKTSLKINNKKINSDRSKLEESKLYLTLSFEKFKQFMKNNDNISNSKIKENISNSQIKEFYRKFRKMNKLVSTHKKKEGDMKKKLKLKNIKKAKDLLKKAKFENDPIKKENLVKKIKILLGEKNDTITHLTDFNDDKENKKIHSKEFWMDLLKKSKNKKVKKQLELIIHHSIKNKELFNKEVKFIAKQNYILKFKYKKLYKKANRIKNKKLKTKKIKKIVYILNNSYLKTIENIIKKKEENKKLAKNISNTLLQLAKRIPDNNIKIKLINKVKMIKAHPSLAKKIQLEIILKQFLKHVPIKCKSYVKNYKKITNKYVEFAAKKVKKENKNTSELKKKVEEIVNDDNLNDIMASTFANWLKDEIENYKEKEELKNYNQKDNIVEDNVKKVIKSSETN